MKKYLGLTTTMINSFKRITLQLELDCKLIAIMVESPKINSVQISTDVHFLPTSHSFSEERALLQAMIDVHDKRLRFKIIAHCML